MHIAVFANYLPIVDNFSYLDHLFHDRKTIFPIVRLARRGPNTPIHIRTQ